MMIVTSAQCTYFLGYTAADGGLSQRPIASPAGSCDGGTTTVATWTQACRRERTHLASSSLWGGGSPLLIDVRQLCTG
jgi:hypothetical protein